MQQQDTHCKLMSTMLAAGWHTRHDAQIELVMDIAALWQAVLCVQRVNSARSSRKQNCGRCSSCMCNRRCNRHSTWGDLHAWQGMQIKHSKPGSAPLGSSSRCCSSRHLQMPTTVGRGSRSCQQRHQPCRSPKLWRLPAQESLHCTHHCQYTHRCITALQVSRWSGTLYCHAQRQSVGKHAKYPVETLQIRSGMQNNNARTKADDSHGSLALLTILRD